MTAFSLKREAFVPKVNVIDLSDITAITWANIQKHPVPFATMVTMLLLYLILIYPTYRADLRKHFIVPEDAKDVAKWRADAIAKVKADIKLMTGRGTRPFLHRLAYRFKEKFLREHLWLSVYFHQRADPFTGVQRMTCVLVLVLTVLTTGAFFFGSNDYASQEAMVAFVISISAAVFTSLFAYFFSRSGPLHPMAAHHLSMEQRVELQFSLKDFENDVEMQASGSDKSRSPGEVQMGEIDPQIQSAYTATPVQSSLATPASPDGGHAATVQSSELPSKNLDKAASATTPEASKYALSEVQYVVASAAASGARTSSGELDLKKAEQQIQREAKRRQVYLGQRFPTWVLATTWVLAITWIALCMWLILAFGMKFDREGVSNNSGGLGGRASDTAWPASTRWLVVALFAVLQDWAINKPISVFVSTLLSLTVAQGAGAGLTFCADQLGCI